MQHNSQETKKSQDTSGQYDSQHVVVDAKHDCIYDPIAAEASAQSDAAHVMNSQCGNSQMEPTNKLFADDCSADTDQVENRNIDEMESSTLINDAKDDSTDRKVQMSVGKQESNFPFRRQSQTSETKVKEQHGLSVSASDATVVASQGEGQDIKSKEDLMAIISRQMMEIRELKESQQSSTQVSRVTTVEKQDGSPRNIDLQKPASVSSQVSLLEDQQVKRPTVSGDKANNSSIWQRVVPRRKEDCLEQGSDEQKSTEAQHKTVHGSHLKRRQPVILHQMSTVSDDMSSPQAAVHGGTSHKQNRRMSTNCSLRVQQQPRTCPSTLEQPVESSPVKPLNGTFSRVSQLLSTLRKCTKKQYSPYLQQGTAGANTLGGKIEQGRNSSLVQTPTLSLPISHNGLANGLTRAGRFDDLDSLRLGVTGSQYRLAQDEDFDAAGESVVQDLLDTTEQRTPIAYKRMRLDELGREVIRRKLASAFTSNEDEFLEHQRGNHRARLLPQKRERQMSFMDEASLPSSSVQPNRQQDGSDRVRGARKCKDQQHARIISKHQIGNKKIREEVPESAQIYVESGETFDFSQIKIDEQVPSTRQFTVYKYKNPRTQRNVKILLCEHANCNMFFRKWHNFFDHLRVHTGERPFKCSEPGCQQSFTQKANLNKHLAVHQRRKKQKCPMCSKIFASQHILKMHMRQHTFQMTQPSGQGSFSPFICSPLLPTTSGATTAGNSGESPQQSCSATNNKYATSFMQRPPAEDKHASFKSPMQQANMQTRAHVNTVNGHLNRLLLQQQRSTTTRGLSSPRDGFLPWRKHQAAAMTSQVRKTTSHLEDISSNDDEDDKLIGRFLVGETSQTQRTAEHTELIKGDKIQPSREFLMQSSQRKTKASFIDSISSQYNSNIRDHFDDSPSKKSSVLVKAVTSVIKQKASYQQQLDISPVAPLRKRLSQKCSVTGFN